MLYSYFSPHAKSWSAQVYPGTPTFSLQPFYIKEYMQIAQNDRRDSLTSAAHCDIIIYISVAYTTTISEVHT